MGKIIVDSCCDLPQEMKEDMGIVSVPLTMMLGDKEYCDDESLDISEFMAQLKGYKGKPGSAAPSPFLYQKAIEAADEAYIVTLSSKLSASYSNAVIGVMQAGEDGGDSAAHVFDSKSASAGETLIALKIFEFISAGMRRADIIKSVSRFIDNMKTYFVLENFGNLQKNGRMSRVQGSLAQLLNFKFIAGDDGNGEIALYEKCRGIEQMIDKLLSLIGKGVKDTDKESIVITHCNNRSMAQQLKELIADRFNFKKIYVIPCGGLSSLYADDKGVILAF